MTIREIVREAGMSDRPAYYSGRGATLSDLNSDRLGTIHRLIKEQLGDDQAQAYVQMVAGLDKASATGFLNSLYGLAANDWVYRPHTISHVDIEKDADGRHNITQGIATIFAAMNSTRDETERIRGEFLRKHGIFTTKNHKRRDHRKRS